MSSEVEPQCDKWRPGLDTNYHHHIIIAHGRQDAAASLGRKDQLRNRHPSCHHLLCIASSYMCSKCSARYHGSSKTLCSRNCSDHESTDVVLCNTAGQCCKPLHTSPLHKPMSETSLYSQSLGCKFAGTQLASAAQTASHCAASAHAADMSSVPLAQ